jgi:hypothetical protein
MTSTLTSRHGNKWTTNEILALQREYELLEMNIQEIAAKHGRSVKAILFKLESEGFISNWMSARGYTDADLESISSKDSYDEESSDVDKLNERIWHLETNVSEIGDIVKQMFSRMKTNTNTRQRRAPLRTQMCTVEY